MTQHALLRILFKSKNISYMVHNASKRIYYMIKYMPAEETYHIDINFGKMQANATYDIY